MTTQSIGQHYLEDALHTFRDYKKLADRAFDQTSEEDFFRTPDPESNSIAIIVKHMAGNMLSRWTDFLTTDGEKPSRNRDMEYVMLPNTTKAEMLAFWEKGWQSVFEAIEPLTPEHLMDRKSTRLNSSHVRISYAVFCLKKKKKKRPSPPEAISKVRRPTY